MRVDGPRHNSGPYCALGIDKAIPAHFISYVMFVLVGSASSCMSWLRVGALCPEEFSCRYAVLSAFAPTECVPTQVESRHKGSLQSECCLQNLCQISECLPMLSA